MKGNEILALKRLQLKCVNKSSLADDKKHWENINAISFCRSWWGFALILKEERTGYRFIWKLFWEAKAMRQKTRASQKVRISLGHKD